MVRSTARLALLLTTAASCTPLSKDGTFQVIVDWDAEITATCLRVAVRDASGAVKQSSPIARPTDRNRIIVAVYQDGFAADVTVDALGFTGTDCSVAAERTSQAATFVPSKNVEVDLHLGLERSDGGPVDADRDGSPAGVDCDDHDPARTPGKVELCGDHLDNNCDGKVDCADATCNGLVCGDSHSACAQGTCRELDCADEADNNGNTLTDCLDPDCAGKPCKFGGTCVALACSGATSEVCTDGVDNDQDGKLDCADPDCSGLACSDNDACTVGEHCVGTTCTGATPKDCAAGLPACVMNAGCDAGTCLPAPRPANTGTCTDGLSCTLNDTCDGDGGCTGTPKECTPSNNPCLRAGCDETAGGCVLTLDLTAACSDHDGCTEPDVCQSDAGCAGTPITCPPPGECQLTGACSQGTCRYPARVGACDGGTCNTMGQCQPTTHAFPYVPSNFTEGQTAGATSGDLSISCAVDVNTQGPDGGAVLMGACLPSQRPTTAVISQPGGPEALLLVVNGNLSVTTNGSLTVHGLRPLIIAVLGSATIEGPVVSTAGVDLGCASRTNLNGTAGNGGRGGGGGAGGGFGAVGANGGPMQNGGTGQAASGNQALVPLRGGCSGGTGATTSTVGGNGGGALQISVVSTLTVNAPISANALGGGGAAGAPAFGNGNGGGGGGSGGALLFEANRFVITNTGGVFANGGGGGQGSGNTAGAPGSPGRLSTLAADGGSGMSNCGGKGGNGGAVTATPTAGSPQTGGLGCPPSGGGGGGGSVGRIRFNAVEGCTISGAVSPQQTGLGTGC